MTDELLDYRPTVPGLEPECEVLVGDTWHPGFIRAWLRYADGWRANVQYSAPAETRDGASFPSNRLATFTADQVRQVEPPG